MIEKLTKTQLDRMAEYRDKWIEIGLSTAPANRPLSEDGIRKAYIAAGLKSPRKIVWCGSPLSQVLTRAIILDQKLINDVMDSVMASVRDSVMDSVWDSVRASVRDSVRDSVMASVRASVSDSVMASVMDSVSDSVLASVRDSVRDSVRASVMASVWDSVRDSGYGQHDANWLAFYEYFREACGLQSQTDKLIGLTEYSKNAGWFLPHQNICWVSERHNILRRDERGRVHDISGPAIMYPDGWAIYAWHGIRVPRWVIEQPQEISDLNIDSEANAEVRRVMLERYGLDRYLLTGSEKDRQGEYRLIEKSVGGVTMRALVMRCPTTQAAYVHCVHPECTTVDGALAWKRGHEDFIKQIKYTKGLIWER